MKKFLLAFLPLALFSLFFPLQAQQPVQIQQQGNLGVQARVLPQNLARISGRSGNAGSGVRPLAAAVTCGPDTVDYTRAKISSGANGITLNGAGSAERGAQWFDAPQSITVHGFGFFGWVTSTTADTVDLVMEVYLADTDSLPMGMPLASDTIGIDSNTANIEHYLSYSSPVTVTQPYVLVLSRVDTTHDVVVLTNDWTVGDGLQEWLSSAFIPGLGWLRSYDIALGPNLFNADFLFMPIVTYDIDPSFTTSPPNGCVGTMFQFDNTPDPVFLSRFYNQAAAFGVPELSFYWDYGDGGVDTLIDGAHSYATSGTFNVVLSDTLYGWRTTCTDTVVDTITVNSGVPVSGGFTFVTSGLNAVFTNTSSGGSTYLWDFGDGSQDTAANPSHTYASFGTYTVCQTVFGSCDTVTTCDTVVVGCTPPTVNFSASVTGMTATFTNTSTGGLQQLWDFGDGSLDTAANPVHTYAANGTYTVCLTVANTCDTVTVCQTVTIGCAMPTASFQYTVQGATVNFVDQTTVSPNQWSWDFGDGSPVSTMQNPSHTFVNSGTYIVCLTASNSCGSDLFCDTVVINCPVPNPAFSFNTTGNTAFFTDQTAGATTWNWSFGDGSTSAQQNPTHTYLSTGTYNVCLTTTNQCGSNTICNQVVITCPAPSTNFSFLPNGGNVNFQDQSTGGATSWFWDFGDGSTSTVQSPSHFYQTGTYTVCLITTNSCGSDTSCQSVQVVCPTPSTAFSFQVTQFTVDYTDNSTGGATAWVWDMGDGTVYQTQNVNHTYAGPGNYNVCLTSTNACGSSTVCQTVTVNCDLPVAGFITAANFGTVSFVDQTTFTPSQWLWDFGDGTTSTLQNPTHVYLANGTYTVCLSAANSCGSDNSCDTLSVTIVGIEEPDFAQSLQVYPNPSAGQFNLRMELTATTDLTLRVTDLVGRELDRFEQNAAAGTFHHTFDLNGLSKGIYLLRIDTPEGSVTRKLIRE